MFFMCIAIILFSSVLYFLERGRFFYCTKKAVNESLCHEGQAWDPKVGAGGYLCVCGGGYLCSAMKARPGTQR